MSNLTEFFRVGGPLECNTPSYIERPADKEIVNCLDRDEFCLVLGPRQSGKSSLMVRAAVKLKQSGVYSAIVDLQTIGNTNNPDLWFGDVVYQNRTS